MQKIWEFFELRETNRMQEKSRGILHWNVSINEFIWLLMQILDKMNTKTELNNAK